MMHPFNYKMFDIKLVMTLLVVAMLPSFVFVAYGSSSLALGMLMSSAVIFILNYNVLRNVRINKLSIIIFLFVSALLLLQSLYIYVYLSLTKPLYSLVIVFIVLSAIVFASKIRDLDFEIISGSVLVSVLALLLIGWSGCFYTPDCCNYIEQGGRPVFPFSEPSHYALIVGILSVAYATVGSFTWLSFIIVNMFALAFLFPSLTLMVFGLLTVFASSLRLKPALFKPIILVFPVFIFFVLFVLLSGTSYFSSRLNFESATNTSALVYLQGWDLAYVNLVETGGTGIGFQMLGSSFAKEGQYSQYHLSNISDGGFLASKMIAEFGVLGLLLLFAYLFIILRFIFHGNKIWYLIRSGVNQECHESLKKRLLLSGVILGFFVEIFIRGYGYFSPGVFLFLASVFYLINNPATKGWDNGFDCQKN